MFVLPVRDCVLGASCILRGNPSQQGQHACDRGLPNARNLYPGPHICGLVGHYWHFIKGFAHIARPLHDILGKEVKMGPVQLPPEAQEVVRTLKGKIQSAPVLEMDTSKEGLGAVLSQKQDDGCYHPVTFGSHSLTPMGKNYHSLKLEVECNEALQGIFGICTFL